MQCPSCGSVLEQDVFDISLDKKLSKEIGSEVIPGAILRCRTCYGEWFCIMVNGETRTFRTKESVTHHLCCD